MLTALYVIEKIANMDNVKNMPVQCASLVGYCCYKVQAHPGGKWQDVGGKHLDKYKGQDISHGICPDCLAAYKTDRAAEMLRKGRSNAKR